ncbi:MAG: hypothetical protein IPM97_12735 [Bdellovibrionaceae bacterium]|nr:hypothetical protein [Pseudobdellovibrionaceae bacterium]
MKNAFVLVSLLLVSNAAFAQFGGGGFPKQTKIENANYFCGDKNGAFVFKVNEPARVWQTELNDQGSAESGLEIEVTEIIRFRSPHHFDIKGFMPAGDDELKYNFKLRADHVTKAITLETKITNEKGEEILLPQTSCSLVP